MMGVTGRIAVKQQQRRNSGNSGGSPAVAAARLPSLRGGDTARRMVRRVFPNQVLCFQINVLSRVSPNGYCQANALDIAFLH